MSELKFFEYNPSTKNPKYLVIFLHGYGSNGANLLDLAYEFAHILPDAHFISPNAPQSWEGGFVDAYQWFSLANIGPERDLGKISSEIKKTSEILDKFIQNQLKRFNLSEKDLFLIGFSQGAMMSMYKGLTLPQKPAGIISYSGKLILPESLGEKIITKPDVCLVHGKMDSVVPFANFIEAKDHLEKLQIPFESHIINELDHSIDLRAIRAGLNFIKTIKQR